MIRAIVIDDEKPSQDVIVKLLKDYCDDVQVVAIANSVKSAFKAINTHKPDLLFLDIELGDGKGFDLLNMFGKIDFKIIFMTAYSEYAIKAFRVNAVDYLLKPIQYNELKSAVDKIKRINDDIKYSENISTSIKEFHERPELDSTLVIPHIKGFEVLKINEIIMCKADGYCTYFHLTGKRIVFSTKNLKLYETVLSKHRFVRVHHSYIVNLSYVCSYTKQGEIILAEKNLAFLGDVYKRDFMKLFLHK